MSVHSWYASSLTGLEFVGLANFRRAFVDDERFRNALWLTLYLAGLATALQLVLGGALAFLLSRQSARAALASKSIGGDSLATPRA